MRGKGRLIWGGLAVLALALVAVAVIFLVPAAEQAAEAPPLTSVTATARGGWYTEAQAERGHEEYDRHCARCHGVDLAGLGPNPPLAGTAFMNRWDGESVGRLFHYTRSTMPLDAPRSLEDDSYVRIIAYTLQVNDFPPGDRELPLDTNQLEQLVIHSGATEEE